MADIFLISNLSNVFCLLPIPGFDILLNNLPDLILDTPEAPTLLGNYIARAVADDCLPPKYVTNPENADKLNEYALTALKRADALLTLKQGWTLLDNIWGSAGPLRPVKNITKQMTLLLKEFLSSRDFEEAQRCLRALEVPHYHHELVYEAIVMSLESVSQTTEEAMCQLLKALDGACLVLPAQMEQVRSEFQFRFFEIRRKAEFFLFYEMVEKFNARQYEKYAKITQKLIGPISKYGFYFQLIRVSKEFTMTWQI